MVEVLDVIYGLPCNWYFWGRRGIGQKRLVTAGLLPVLYTCRYITLGRDKEAESNNETATRGRNSESRYKLEAATPMPI